MHNLPLGTVYGSRPRSLRHARRQLFFANLASAQPSTYTPSLKPSSSERPKVNLVYFADIWPSAADLLWSACAATVVSAKSGVRWLWREGAGGSSTADYETTTIVPERPEGLAAAVAHLSICDCAELATSLSSRGGSCQTHSLAVLTYSLLCPAFLIPLARSLDAHLRRRAGLRCCCPLEHPIPPCRYGRGRHDGLAVHVPRVANGGRRGVPLQRLRRGRTMAKTLGAGAIYILTPVCRRSWRRARRSSLVSLLIHRYTTART